MKKITSTDIAKLAGVSRSTVSRVVNGYSNVPEATRKKVMKVIEENSYYPQLSGQLLSGKKTKTIGLFWIKNVETKAKSNEYHIATDSLTSAYYMYITEAAAKRGYLVLSCIVNNLKDKENIDWIKSIFIQERIDGGIFIGTKNTEPLIEELLSMGKIIGLFGHMPESEFKKNRLVSNFEDNTGEKVIDYLYEKGHREIAVIDGDIKRFSFYERHNSYIKGLLKYDLKIRNRWMCFGGMSYKTGYEAATKFLKNCKGQYPTAICACNDTVALGTIQAMRDFDCSLLDKISVVGMDGHPSGRTSSPKLTTFIFDFNNLFTSLVDRTIDTIEGKEEVTAVEYFESRLFEGESCKDIN